MLQQLVEPTIDIVADRLHRSRILNATSGSAASMGAAAAAAVIANECDGELVVVHVCPPEVLRVARFGPTIVRNVRLRDPHKSPVLSATRQVAWANGAFARVILMGGEPVPAILSLADELAVDLIVIGASGSRAPAVLTGRVRYRIQRDAPCAVRVISLPPSAAAQRSRRTVPAT
jgi:nucleotide-binding universal stress UspA family protein